MEVIFVELPYKTGEIAVLEVFWEDRLGKFFALDSKKETCRLVAVFPETMASPRRGDEGVAHLPPIRRSCHCRLPIGQSAHMRDLLAFCDIAVRHNCARDRDAGEGRDIADGHLLVQFADLREHY